jgi:hypothetical protein
MSADKLVFHVYQEPGLPDGLDSVDAWGEFARLEHLSDLSMAEVLGREPLARHLPIICQNSEPHYRDELLMAEEKDGDGHG